MTVEYHIVIPARMASQRLPGKPLISVHGRPLIEHVYHQACKSSARSVVIATDSREIRAAAVGFGADAVMTSGDHESGSDRIAECIDIKGWSDDTLVVNLQGDEPLMPEACLDQVAGILHGAPSADVASLCWPIRKARTVKNSNVVKVVVAESGRALYFSRAVIPHPRNSSVNAAVQAGITWYRHIGLYAYRAHALRTFAALQPTPLERQEKLEQLRFLETGRIITVNQACEYIPAGVDTAEDLERVSTLISGAN